MSKIRVEGNGRRGRPKKKRIEIIRENTKACRVDEGMVRDREG